MTDAIAPDDHDAPFWEGARRGQLMMQNCANCKRLRFPPRAMCPWCHCFDTNWRQMSGRATIWSFVVPHPPLTAEFEQVAPYNVVVVALEEDPDIRMVGNLVASEKGAINEIDPAKIRIGAKVRVVFQESGGIVLPRWVCV